MVKYFTVEQFLEQCENILEVKFTGVQLTRLESGCIIKDVDLWPGMMMEICVEWKTVVLNGKIVNFRKGEAE